MRSSEPEQLLFSELYVQDMGVYRWGSLLPEFGTLSQARAHDFAGNLVSLIEGIGNWSTPVEFRAWACLSHELVHYLQDLTTGVGHWDHKVREDARPQLVGAAKFLCESGLVDFPSDVGRRELNDRLLMLVGKALPEERLESLREKVAPLLVGIDAVDKFRVESVLEGEAAALVLAQVIGVKGATKTQWQILNENMGVWHPDHMPAEYGFLWDELQALMTDEEEVDLSDSELDKLFLLLAQFVGTMADISCAHPPPEMLEEREEDRSEYEPGLRFLRLLEAIARQSRESLEQLLDAVGRRDGERAERLMLETSTYPYPPSRSVYEAWLPTFEVSDSRIDALRAETCRIRLENPSAWIEKSLFSILENKLPFTVAGPEGFTSLGQRWEHLDPSLGAQLYFDLTRHAMEDATLSFFFETGRFVCPLGVGRACESASDACREGLRQTSDFPPSPGCEARQRLEDAGFELGVAN